MMNVTVTGEKNQRLSNRLADLKRVVVAFSGGVDSSFLLHRAVEILGKEAKACLVVSESLAATERTRAKETALALGVELVELAGID